jgi:L-histidine Nalpha-methyltransferase / hercynylcysteine S-oxide synthase
MPLASSSPTKVQIIDIRGSTILSNTDENMLQAIVSGISNLSVPFEDARAIRKGLKPTKILLRSLPTMILYNDKGLEIFDQLTYNEDYYLTNAEIDILKRNSADIIRDYVSNGAVLIELGAGAMRKTKYLLEAIQESKKQVTYCAVDLAKDSLVQSLSPLVAAFPSIKFIGLWGTYDDSLEWTKHNVPTLSRTIYFWLGSSIGNLTRKQAADFMTCFQKEGMNNGDLFICGIDKRNDFDLVSLAYNDRYYKSI